MANFDPASDTAVPPDYTRNSEGPRATSNDALGGLFQGLAQTANAGIAEADRSERQKIGEDILEQATSVQNEFGVGSATDVQSDAESSTPRPAALDKAYTNLDALQNAYVKGGIQESHYWARLNVMVRQLRAKYPGYSDDIDSMVSNVVGAKPANALQSSLFQEWNDAKSAASAPTPLSKLEANAVQDGTLPPDYFQRQQENQPYSYPELASYVSNKTRTKADVASRQADMSLQIDQNKVQVQDMQNSYRTDATQFVTTLIDDSTHAIGKTYADVQAKIAAAQKSMADGNPPDEVELQTLRGSIGQLRLQAEQALNQQFLKSWDGDPTHSYVGHIDKQTQQDIVTQALEPIDLLASAFNSKDNPYAIIGSVAAVTQASKDQASANLLSQIPALGQLSALNDIAGPNVAGMYLDRNPQMQDALSKTLIDAASTSAALGKGTVTDALTNGEKANSGAEYYNGLMDRWAKLSNDIDGGKIPLDLIQKNVQYMFSDQDGQMAKLDDDSRYKWFTTVASPQVTAQMLKLKDLGDTQSWNTYQDWVKGNFVNLFSTSMRTIAGQTSSPNSIVSWDNDSSTFKFNNNAIPGANSLNYLPGGIGTYMNQINSAIQTIKPIIEENGGDVNKELALMMGAMGYPADSTTLPGAMNNELEKAIKSDGDNGAAADRPKSRASRAAGQ